MMMMMMMMMMLWCGDANTLAVQSDADTTSCDADDFACHLTFHTVSPSSGLVKLLALSNFQARCFWHLVLCVSPDDDRPSCFKHLVQSLALLSPLLDAPSCHRSYSMTTLSADFLPACPVHRQ